MDKRTRSSKRKEPATDSTETTDAKRAKPGPRTLRSGAGKKENKINEYTPDQSYWIRLHFYMVDSAVLNRPYTAPSGAVSCAYFNAYWQGFITETFYDERTGKWEDPKAQFPIRTFRDFDGMRRNLVPDILNNIATNSLKNTGSDPFRPVITPANLAEFHQIYDRYGDQNGFDFENETGREELNEFLERTIDEHLLPVDESVEPSWVNKGRENLRSRPNPRHYKNKRSDWHADLSVSRDPKDFLRAFNPATGEREFIRMVRRRAHADVGNALLNMAVMRPEGYDGDLNSLIFDLSAMSGEPTEQFNTHIQAAACGQQLKQELDDQADWGNEADEADGPTEPAKATKTAEGKTTAVVETTEVAEDVMTGAGVDNEE